MIVRKAMLSVAGLSALLAAGCASTKSEKTAEMESNSAIVSVRTIGSSSDSSPSRVEPVYNNSNNPAPRNISGQTVGTLSPMEKLRRSRQ